MIMHNKDAQVKMVAVDMDGTLLKSDKTLDPETIRDIDEAKSRGTEVVYCTGRALPELAAYREKLAMIHYGVCMTGALIYDFAENRSIHRRPLNRDCIRAFMAASEEYGAMVQLLTEEHSIVRADQVVSMDDFNLGIYQPMFQENATIVDDLREEMKNHEAFLKANVHFHTSEERQECYEKLKRLPMTFVFSEVSTIEMMALGVSKASGLEMLSKCLGIPMAMVMGIGDGNNDYDMLSKAGIAVAMGNAGDRLKSICDYVTEDNDHNRAGKALRHVCHLSNSL